MARGNVEVLRQVFDAAARGDDETVLALYDPDVVWDGSRSRWFEVLPGDPVWRGHDGLRQFFADYYEAWENLEHEIAEVIELDDRVVAKVAARGRGRASGVEVEWAANVGVFTVRHGRIVEVVWFSDFEEALEAARASGP